MDRGLEILDEMVAVLDECGAVLLMLSDEAALNLDELGEVVDVARGEAINAFGAASLLNKHAELSESWTGDLSRPRAIYARHSKAVRNGAARVKPAVPTVRFPMAEEAIEHVLDAHQQSGETSVERPTCSAFAKSKGRRCTKLAAWMGPNEFLPHCYGHLDEDERRQYDERRDRRAEQERLHRAEVVARLYEEGRMVAAEWAERRRQRHDS
ncbi:hypothetical protein EF294_05975 [Gordonia oryzae]|uniref:Uncharacterized protein n=2 Tax=Gordonia oryzae TaxID=2487349 RepID=A0A3N4HFE3_9ACTN|nr:hypothetical protein EF294_05975 [Gordonia oryzae]